MRKLWDKIKDPTFWGGLAIAVPAFNWANITPVGSQTWWFSVFAVVGGVVAAILKNPGEH